MLFHDVTWSVWSLVHTSDIVIRTRSMQKQSMKCPLGLEKTKQQKFFFVSSFVELCAYSWTMILCLCLWRSFMSQAWLHSFVLSLCSVLMLMLMFKCEPGFTCLLCWVSFFPYSMLVSRTKISYMILLVKNIWNWNSLTYEILHSHIKNQNVFTYEIPRTYVKCWCSKHVFRMWNTKHMKYWCQIWNWNLFTDDMPFTHVKWHVAFS